MESSLTEKFDNYAGAYSLVNVFSIPTNDVIVGTPENHAKRYEWIRNILGLSPLNLIGINPVDYVTDIPFVGGVDINRIIGRNPGVPDQNIQGFKDAQFINHSGGRIDTAQVAGYGWWNGGHYQGKLNNFGQIQYLEVDAFGHAQNTGDSGLPFDTKNVAIIDAAFIEGGTLVNGANGFVGEVTVKGRWITPDQAGTGRTDDAYHNANYTTEREPPIAKPHPCSR